MRKVIKLSRRGGSTTQSQVQGTAFRPDQDQSLTQAFQGVAQGGQQAQQGVQSAIGQLPTAPTLNSNFSQNFNPNAAATLDNTSKAQLGQVQAQQQGQLAAQQSQLQRQLGPGQSKLAGVLGAQAGQQQVLNQGNNYFNAQQNQLTRNVQNANIGSQLQQAGNSSQLDQFDAGQSGAAMQANLSSLLAQIPQSTLASLFGSAQGMGQQYAVTPQQINGTVGVNGQGAGTITTPNTPISQVTPISRGNL